MPWILGILLFCYVQVVCAEKEGAILRNVEQLTFASMGFEKAGEAYFSPDGEEIIFQAVPTGCEHYQMFTMRLSDRFPKMVSTGKGACTCGFYRPDGKKIIFASSHESPEELKKVDPADKYKWDLIPYMNIYEANPDGSELKRLTSGPAYHAECGYSPDGSQIVYASNEEGSMNLYIMNADGSHPRALTHTTHCYNGGPFFSPDGMHVIFRADREAPNGFQVFSIRSDGTHEKQLTHSQALNWAPFWHPNGEWMAYTTSKNGHGSYDIYLMHIPTEKEYRMTYSPFFDGLPSFNREGNKMLWTSKRSGGNCQIFIADFVLETINGL
jgi:Tol biopolymer transport system component